MKRLFFSDRLSLESAVLDIPLACGEVLRQNRQILLGLVVKGSNRKLLFLDRRSIDGVHVGGGHSVGD